MISLRAGDAVAEIVPERGAICSRLSLGGSELLYLDAATLADPAKNVRGGVPLLFPIAGKPDAGSALKQHGFARNLAWEAARTSDSSLECRLRSSAETHAMFAHDFDALVTFSLREDALVLRFELHNTGDAPVPWQFGLHPYFLVLDKAAARVETSATRAIDNRTGTEVPLPKLDFTLEHDLQLLDHGVAGTVLHRPPLPPVELQWSPEFKRMVLWTLTGRDFVCVEPWTTRTLELGPGERASLALQISV